MAHAQRAERAFAPSATNAIAAAALAAILMISAALVAFDPIGLRRGDGPAVVDAAVIQAGLQWELQREEQAGFRDPVIDAGRDWQRQREQQSGD